MIVPMKKAAIFVEEQDGPAAAARLRSLGIVHIEHRQPPQGKDIASLRDDIATLDRVITILSLPAICGKSGLRDLPRIDEWRFSAKHILDTVARIDQLEEFSRSLSAQIAAWRVWGDFDPARIESLRGSGVSVRLYEIPDRELASVPPAVVVRRIGKARGVTCCACVFLGEGSLPYKEVALPAMGLREMQVRLTENDDIVRSLRDMMRRFACYLERFRHIRGAFARELELHEAVRGMGAEGRIAYLTGYLPADTVDALRQAARAERWGLAIYDPGPDDPVPTLVRNPRWVSIIAPVFRLIEIVPGYRELDISPVFLLFLGLFFGMIIGDAGYGALYIAITAFVQWRIGARTPDRRVFFLLYFFNAFAIMWGLLTGTCFGQAWVAQAGFAGFAPALNDTKNLQAFCFLVGAVHLTIAQGWQGIRKLPSPTAIADAGWIMILWAAYFLARMLILSDPLPVFVRWLVIGGVGLAVIGTAPQRNILKMIAEGLGGVALNIMNNFTDVVSYVRLFAVGLAGVAISDTVNTLAAGSGNAVAAVLIVFAGHTINCVLGPMGVLVHGIRLNVLEFSGHAGLTWAGTAYKPLKD